MKIFCHTCRRSFTAGEKEIVYDNGSNMAVFRCPTCKIQYLAIADDTVGPTPRLLKLTLTKSYAIPEEESKIVKPAESRLILTPKEALAEQKEIRKRLQR